MKALSVCSPHLPCGVCVFQVEKLQVQQAELKASSQQEAAHLWSQLEAMRSSRQELGGEEWPRAPLANSTTDQHGFLWLLIHSEKTCHV